MHLNCWEICDRAVKVLTRNFYCSITSIKLLQVLSLKFCLTLDPAIRLKTSKKCCSLTVDFRKYFELTVDFQFDRGHRYTHSVYVRDIPLIRLINKVLTALKHR